MRQLFKQLTPCVRTSAFGFSWYSWLSAWVQRSMLAPVSRQICAIRVACKDNRKFTALLLIAAGPLAENAYKLFDQSAELVSGYWNTYFMLFSVGTDVSVLLWATAFFLLMPDNTPLRMFALIPAVYRVAHMMWMPFVSDNAGYHQYIPFAFLMSALAFVLAWFMAFDWLTNLHYHKRTRPIATAKGIIKMPGKSAEDKLPMIYNELTTLESVLK